METNELIKKVIERMNDNIYVGISGISCSGKSTLSKIIKSELESKGISVSIIKQDEFYKDLKELVVDQYGRINAESKNSFDLELMYEKLKQLNLLGKADYYKYNMSKNERSKEKIDVIKSDVNIIEGLHATDIIYSLKERMNGILNTFTIYLDINKKECKRRRIERDNKLYNVEKLKISNNYDLVIENYLPYEKQKYYSDVIEK